MISLYLILFALQLRIFTLFDDERHQTFTLGSCEHTAVHLPVNVSACVREVHINARSLLSEYGTQSYEANQENRL